MKTSARGFSIVELLIVIVIIGILSALVVAVFGGAQQRANNNNTLTVVVSYLKATRQYAADNGKYPEPSAGVVAWSCLGNGYPGACFNTGASPACAGGIGAVSSQAWYNDAVKLYLNNKTPPTDLQIIPCSGVLLQGGGYLSNWPVAGQGGIFYLLKNTVNCGSPGGITGTQWFIADTTHVGCYITLPTTL